MNKSRRKFLQYLGLGAAGLALTPEKVLAQEKDKPSKGKDVLITGASEKPGEVFLAWKDTNPSDHNVYFWPADDKTLENLSIINSFNADKRGVLNCGSVGNLSLDTEYNFKVIGDKGYSSQIVPVKTTGLETFVLDGETMKTNFKPTFKNMAYHKKNKVFIFTVNGAKLDLEFDLQNNPRAAYLSLDGLSSGDANAFNEGYSPYDLSLNGEFVQIGGAFGGHSKSNVRFGIKPKQGKNIIEIELLDGSKTPGISAQTKLWVYRAEVNCTFGEHYKKPEDLLKKL